MSYIIIETENITQDILDNLNGDQITQPTVIYITEPDIETQTEGVLSAYSYIVANEDYPTGFKGYKKLTVGEFNNAVSQIQSSGYFETKIKEKVNTTNQPFAAKVLADGRKLFQRVHGESYTLNSGANTFEFEVPYPQVKFNEIEIIGAELGDRADLNVLDTASGLISGIPNFKLNQFGSGVYIKPDYYPRASNYDADLFQGMKISMDYNSQSAKTIYINFILHEVKN
jgi:hypothetical protein